ncbi:MAG: hypothetical protein GX964_10440 [Syntrophomonadaceae bacterium]|jgi:hypothetical protein|nr:hypothetical protein [Syntrophomonadaceae bacterium]
MRERAGNVFLVLSVVVILGVTALLDQVMFYRCDFAPDSELILYKFDYREPCKLTEAEQKELRRLLRYSLKIPVNPQQFYPEYFITYSNSAGEARRLYILRSARIGWDDNGQALTLNSRLCRLLDNPIINLENAIDQRYGELIHWDQAQHILAMYDRALVTDVDTGRSFWVQRRGGSKHADVQPLTARDTHIMKAIYNGKWSWDRRAVIVSSRNRRVAASMNGMPHGAGAIKDNDFDGHFCIHFYASRTHGGNRVDERHQNMVLKAAGLIEGAKLLPGTVKKTVQDDGGR